MIKKPLYCSVAVILRTKLPLGKQQIKFSPLVNNKLSLIVVVVVEVVVVEVIVVVVVVVAVVVVVTTN